MKTEMIEIRAETPADIAAVRVVNRRAFGQDAEGHIIDALRASRAVLCSLVAIDQEGDVVGHIMYSPARAGSVLGAALGPMAVVPERQRQGIGTRLVEAGNHQVVASGYPFIVLVGHPAFYSRCGFMPARAYGMTCEWDVPDDVFMVRVLDPGRMADAVGLVHYRPEFAVTGRVPNPPPSTEFVIEETIECADGRVCVLARVVGSADFEVGPDVALAGCPIEQWLDIPRAIDDTGQQRTDLFAFCLKDARDRARLKAGDRVVLQGR